MGYVDAIVQKFDGIRPMATKTGIPPSTIQGWVNAGVIPARRQAEVMEWAHRLQIPMSPADFFESAGVAA
jgi:hypothetical protein